MDLDYDLLIVNTVEIASGNVCVTSCGRLHAVPGTVPRVYVGLAVNGLSLALTLGETAHLPALQITYHPISSDGCGAQMYSGNTPQEIMHLGSLVLL